MPDLMLCVRNSNGSFTGHVDAAEIFDGDSFCALDARPLSNDPVFVDYEKHEGKLRAIKLVGLYIRVRNHGTHVGNILWDSYDITEADANRLLVAMRESGQFDMVDGTLDFCAAWREPELAKRTPEGRLVF